MAQHRLSTTVGSSGTGVEASLRGRAARRALHPTCSHMVALGFPGTGGSAGSGHSNAGFPKSLTPFSSPVAAWLNLQEGRARGPATVTPSLEKLSRGPSTIVILAGVHPPQHTGDLVARPHSETEVPLKGALSLQTEHQVAEDGPSLCPHLCPHPPTPPPAAETQTHTPHIPSPCSPSPRAFAHTVLSASRSFPRLYWGNSYRYLQTSPHGDLHGKHSPLLLGFFPSVTTLFCPEAVSWGGRLSYGSPQPPAS